VKVTKEIELEITSDVCQPRAPITIPSSASCNNTVNFPESCTFYPEA